jgi:hypothetical protein
MNETTHSVVAERDYRTQLFAPETPGETGAIMPAVDREESPHAAAVDWRAAEAIADRLGIHSCRLVAERDAEAVKAWALQQAGHHDGGDNRSRADSYYKLAIVAGYVPPEGIGDAA